MQFDCRQFRERLELQKGEKSEKGETPKTKINFQTPASDPVTSSPLITLKQPEAFTPPTFPQQTAIRLPQHIAELVYIFEHITLPSPPVQLSPCEIITDVQKFVNSHIALLTSNPSKSVYAAYYNRLVNFKNLI
jgi:hypothetical protein